VQEKDMQRLTFRLTITFLSGLIYLAASTFTLTAQEKSSSSPPPANDNARWERYTGKNEAFTVLLPERPTAVVNYRRVRFILGTEAERFRGTLYSAYSDGVLYLIYSFPRRSEPIKQFVDEFANQYSYIQKVVDAREVNLNGVLGHRYLVKFRDIDAVMDFYVTSNRAYILHVVGGDESNPSVKRFLESFTIGNADGNNKPTDSAAIEIKPDSKKSSQIDEPLDSSPVYSTRDVTRKAVIVFRPEPQYSEDAREGRVSGTVVLKAVLSSSGKVTRIEAEKSLPRGLTEKSMEAARQIKFVPAIKDGKYVSQTIHVEYNFSVY
jgi:TonB family protein